MTNILVPSVASDSDSLIVQAALTAAGHKVWRWVGDNFPTRQTGSFFIRNGHQGVGEFREETHTISTKDIDVVWLRRPRWPVVSHTLHHADRLVAEQESKHFVRSFFHAAWADAIWVNSSEGKRRAGSKLLQLQLATEIGLCIPDTLVSNDPSNVRNFVNEHDGRVIVKALLSGDWVEDGKRFVSYTAPVGLADLVNDEMISACPCVYQRQIEKSYEVRVTFFGQTALAVRLDSQSHDESTVDWRAGDARKLKASATRLPLSAYEKCVELMRRLGIVHGSFDFAVTPNGEWVFFEVNEAGQFIWLETFVPDLPVVDTFVQFLSNPSPQFISKKSDDPIKVKKIVRTLEYQNLVRDDQSNLAALGKTAFL